MLNVESKAPASVQSQPKVDELAKQKKESKDVQRLKCVAETGGPVSQSFFGQVHSAPDLFNF